LGIAPSLAPRYDRGMGHSESRETFDPDLPFFEQMDPAAFDPVIEAFKRDIDFTLVERNLQLTTDERAQ
jgi:hypothetical protein